MDFKSVFFPLLAQNPDQTIATVTKTRLKILTAVLWKKSSSTNFHRLTINFWVKKNMMLFELMIYTMKELAMKLKN